MNNFIGAFSIYEVLRILIPGFYFSLMLEKIINTSFHKFNNQLFEIHPILFVIVSIILGALFYAMDIPRWFKKHYSTLPSNLILKNKELLNIQQDSTLRPYEDIYYQFYYSRPTHTIFKTEIQSGFFHLFVTMSFIGAIFIIIHSICMFFSILLPVYFFLNLFLTVVAIVGAIVIYKIKLRHSWKRNYDEFVNDLKGEKNDKT